MVHDQVAALIQAWHFFKKGEGCVEGMDAAINHLAMKANVEVFGVEGETVPFEPFAHYVINPSGNEITDVEIVLFGVRAIRDNGSHRILSRALVKQVN
jgi:hypothetical protein